MNFDATLFMAALRQKLRTARWQPLSRTERIMYRNQMYDNYPWLRWVTSGSIMTAAVQKTDMKIPISAEEIKALAKKDYDNGTPPRWQEETYMAEYAKLYQAGESSELP
jgi:hypothetical protein